MRWKPLIFALLGNVLVIMTVMAEAVSAQPIPAVTTLPWPVSELLAESGMRRFQTSHTGVFNGHRVKYNATVSETLVKDRNKRSAASVFTIAYTATTGDRSKRPVIFVYNGGPGGASTFLNFGAFGPMRMENFTVAAQADPSTKLVDNAYSVLDVADIVFIDPPDTGFSRTLPGVDKSLFHSNDADSAACVQVIVRWLEENGRLQAPVYLAGESFGTHRNIMIGRDLQLAKPGLKVAGMVMVSGPVPASQAPDPGVLEAVNRVIDVSAWAWYYGKIDNRGQSLGESIGKARTFAMRDYVEALLLGNRLDEAGRQRIAERLESLTGLSKTYFLENRLVIQSPTRDLLKDEGKLLMRFDIRDVEDAATSLKDEDRDWVAAFRGLDANMDRYSRDVLKVTGLEAYRTVAADAIGWKWSFVPQTELQRMLAKQMSEDRDLRVMIAVGLFDSAASMGADEQVFAQIGNKGQSTIAYYAAGHMLYSDLAGLEAFMRDVRAFVQRKPIPGGAMPAAAPGRPSAFR